MATRRKEQAAQTRQKILDASQKLMGERGYANVTVEDIAHEAGIGKGTMYHYFPGKEAILSYIERGRFREVKAQIDQITFPCVMDKLTEFIRCWCACVESDNLYLSKDWHKLAVDLKLPHNNGLTHLDEDIANLSQFLNEGIENGEFRASMPVRVIAKDLAFSLYGASFYRCSAYSVFHLNEWAEEFVRHALVAHVSPWRAAPTTTSTN